MSQKCKNFGRRPVRFRSQFLFSPVSASGQSNAAGGQVVNRSDKAGVRCALKHVVVIGYHAERRNWKDCISFWFRHLLVAEEGGRAIHVTSCAEGGSWFLCVLYVYTWMDVFLCSFDLRVTDRQDRFRCQRWQISTNLPTVCLHSPCRVTRAPAG